MSETTGSLTTKDWQPRATGFGAVVVVVGVVVLATFGQLVDSEVVPGGSQPPLWLVLTLVLGALLVVGGFTAFAVGGIAGFVAAVRDAVRHKLA